MRTCGNCRRPTVAHVLIANHGVCHTCADEQNKNREEAILKQYQEYRKLEGK